MVQTSRGFNCGLRVGENRHSPALVSFATRSVVVLFCLLRALGNLVVDDSNLGVVTIEAGPHDGALVAGRLAVGPRASLPESRGRRLCMFTTHRTFRTFELSDFLSRRQLS